MLSGFVERVLKILTISSKAVLLFHVMLSFREVECCVSSGFPVQLFRVTSCLKTCSRLLAFIYSHIQKPPSAVEQKLQFRMFVYMMAIELCSSSVAGDLLETL